VADAPLSLKMLAPPVVTQGTSFTGVVATFSDGNALAPPSDFTATITWGDGATTTGSVVGLGGGSFAVVGSHTYTKSGALPFSVSVSDDGGSKLSASGTASVGAVASSGAAVTMAELDRVWLDALLIADGLLMSDDSLIEIGLGDYLMFTAGLPGDVRGQLQAQLFQDGLSDLVFLSLTGA
jgi:hypothetical protein